MNSKYACNKCGIGLIHKGASWVSLDNSTKCQKGGVHEAIDSDDVDLRYVQMLFHD